MKAGSSPVRNVLRVGGTVVVVALLVTGCLTIQPDSVPTLYVGLGTSLQLKGTGAKGVVEWSATGLPSGLNVNPSTGELSGVPLTSGTFTVNLIATDHGDNDANTTKSIPISVVAPNSPVLPAAGNAGSFKPVISSNGRYLAFASAATNLLPGTLPFPGASNIYTLDRQTGVLLRLTDFYNVSTIDISGDGRYVVWGNGGDLYVWDRTTATTTKVLVGNKSIDAHSASISDDGRYLAFHTTASGLVGVDVYPGWTQVYVFDRDTGSLVRLTEAQAFSGYPQISADGQYVAFNSQSDVLTPGDTNGKQDVFLWSRATGTLTRVTSGNGDSDLWGISGTGGFLSIQSSASNLVAGDPTGHTGAFVWERATTKFTRVSPGTADVSSPVISDDASTVVFASDSSTIVPGDVNGQTDLFLWDRTSGTIVRLPSGNGYSSISETGLSADGRVIAFGSESSDLVAGDTNGLGDIFTWAR